MEKSYEVRTDILIALCHILDDFEEFNKNLKQIITFSNISYKDFNNFEQKLRKISEGKHCLGARKIKKFYNENKAVIDTINKYTSKRVRDSSFIRYFMYGYNLDDEKSKTSDRSKYFYEYILSHKKDIDKILKLLKKIRDLGFDTFIFNEDVDFTQEKYKIYSVFDGNYSIIYLDNIEVLPDYGSDISYRTTSSNYKMELSVGDIFPIYRESLVLNSLLFDPERLPKRIDKENTFDNIVELKKAQQQTSLTEDTINLSGIISDLDSQSNSINRIINRLESAQNREELLGVLTGIKNDIKKLETISTQYDSIISEKEPSLTPKILKRKNICSTGRDDKKLFVSEIL